MGGLFGHADMQKKMGLIKTFITWIYGKYVFLPMLDERKMEIIEEVTIAEDDPYWPQLQRERLFSELH